MVVNLSLWFGSELEHLLFNGLFARDADDDLCTDPYNERGLRFDLQRVASGQNMHIAMDRVLGLLKYRCLEGCTTAGTTV
jgi:hypothetical protein